MSVNLKQLKKVRCRLIDKATGQPVAGIVVSLAVGFDGAATSIPISTLRSDSTGYLSFDLKSLIDLGLTEVSSLYISAPQIALKDFDFLEEIGVSAENNSTRMEAMSSVSSSANLDRKHLCIEFPILVERIKVDEQTTENLCQSADLPSVQNPDPCDYALSPHSFVSPIKLNLGGDCCESLTPSTLPVQEHLFYRVIVRRDRNGDPETVETSINRVVEITGNLVQPPPKIKFADVLDYRQSWYAIGHSLGEIKYSLPLAPGESTQLAVIEWSRSDAATRLDSVTAKEELSHWQKRDRTIEETIDAGLKESQGGWSWAGGLSSGMAYDAKAYGQYTGNWAAGGGTSNSWGERDLEADSLQELHDTISQSTTYTRSLNSTVIVQASQAELNNVQTRRVANHNHCHALTIQYYEVLRHLRLRTEFVAKRRAVLIPFSTFTFSRGIAIRFRTALELALLDRSIASFFDALVRLELDLYPAQATGSGSSSGPTYFAGMLPGLVVDARTFPMYPVINGARIVIEKGSTVHISAKAQAGGIKFPIAGQPTASYDVDGQHGAAAPDNGRWPMPGAQSFSLLAKVGPDFYPVGKDASFVARNEGVLSFWFNDAEPGDNEGTATAELTVSAPKQSTPPNEEKVPQTIADPKQADKIKEAFLLKHLDANIGYYNRAVWFLMDPVERRLYLEMALGHDSDLLSAIDDKPIAVSGSLVAFVYDGPVPSEDENENKPEPFESIVTLPTRGLFAEAQMGHCNSCEKRDVTRMWNWTEMTVEEPPAITGIEPGPRGQTPTMTPTQLPANVIQIAPTPAAPDPAGLAAALKLLGTPDIFRDMSGLDEASAILGKLVDGTTTTLAAMVKGAAAAKEKVDAARSGSTGASGADSKTDSKTQRAEPNEKDAAAQVDRLRAIEEGKNKNLLTDKQANDAAVGVVGGEVIQTASIDRNVSVPMGIDVSHHQGNINWEKVAASNIYFAFIKASDGQNFDNKFQTNWRSAREAGLTCGAYHFWLPQVPGKKQAETLISQLGFLQRGDLPPVLDVEDATHSKFAGLSVTDLENNIQEFIDTIQAEFGVAPIIYTNPGFWKAANFMDNSTKFSNYLLWIANYDPKNDPTLPGGWPTWEFWQLTDSGRVDGVIGLVDMNMFNGDLVTLWQMAGRDSKTIQI